MALGKKGKKNVSTDPTSKWPITNYSSKMTETIVTSIDSKFFLTIRRRLINYS